MSYLPLPRDAKPPDSESVAGILQVANLGDSGCMVLRDGRIVLRTVEQTHAFNFPRQLGTVRAAAAALSPLGAAATHLALRARAGAQGSQDTPTDADRLSIPVEPGDIIVLGTDGLFDK